jgi:hypothetical protein
MIAGTTTCGSRLPTWPAHIAATRARPVKCMRTTLSARRLGCQTPFSAQNDTVVAPNPQQIPKLTQGLAGYSNPSPPVQVSSRPGGMGLSGGAAGMAAGGCRLLAVLAMLLLPVTAVAQVIPPGAQPGRERGAIGSAGAGPAGPPGGATITLPQRSHPPAREHQLTIAASSSPVRPSTATRTSPRSTPT